MWLKYQVAIVLALVCINQNKRCTGTCIVGVTNVHGSCSFHVHQTGGWFFLSVFLYSSVKEYPYCDVHLCIIG